MFARLSQRSVRYLRPGSTLTRSSKIMRTVPKQYFSATPSVVGRYSHISSVFSRYYSSGSDNTIQFKLADVGEGIAECEILKWHVEEGKQIEQFDMICEVQSDKATAEITSPFDGTITKLYYQPGDMAAVGSPLIDIAVEGEVAQDAPKKKETVERNNTASEAVSSAKVADHETQYQTLQTKSGPVKILAAPAVRRIAKENNIDLKNVTGSGKDGRVLKDDILAFIEGGMSSSVSSSHTGSSMASTAEKPIYQLEDREVPVKGIKKVMVKSMTAACQVPHFGYCDEILFNELKSLREQLKPLAEEKNIKLSYLPFVIKACSLALKDYPDLNAYTNSDCTSVTLKGSHNIGLAMDTPSGLIVPNIKNVQDLSILEIAKQLNELQALGLSGKLEKHHLEGGTFTLSNVGAIGGTYASPVLFLPQVAIGAIGKIQTLPRFDDGGNVFPAQVVNVSWSADHRVIDGATMARFSNSMKNFIEKPNAMLVAMH